MTQDERTATLTERKRIVGLLLAAYARYHNAGHHEIANVIDKLANYAEHPEIENPFLPYAERERE
jgi:hypothetical protein